MCGGKGVLSVARSMFLVELQGPSAATDILFIANNTCDSCILWCFQWKTATAQRPQLLTFVVMQIQTSQLWPYTETGTKDPMQTSRHIEGWLRFESGDNDKDNMQIMNN
jgi:hypothetical protein